MKKYSRNKPRFKNKERQRMAGELERLNESLSEEKRLHQVTEEKRRVAVNALKHSRVVTLSSKPGFRDTADVICASMISSAARQCAMNLANDDSFNEYIRYGCNIVSRAVEHNPSILGLVAQPQGEFCAAIFEDLTRDDFTIEVTLPPVDVKHRMAWADFHNSNYLTKYPTRLSFRDSQW